MSVTTKISFSDLPNEIQSIYKGMPVVCYRSTHSQFGTVYVVNETYYRRCWGTWVTY